MRHQTNERSFQLCQLASIEQDPAKLLLLVTEINRMLEEKEERLKRKRRDAVAPPVSGKIGAQKAASVGAKTGSHGKTVSKSVCGESARRRSISVTLSEVQRQCSDTRHCNHNEDDEA